MNDCYLSLLLNFRALLSIDSGANLVNSKQAIGVIAWLCSSRREFRYWAIYCFVCVSYGRV